MPKSHIDGVERTHRRIANQIILAGLTAAVAKFPDHAGSYEKADAEKILSYLAKKVDSIVKYNSLAADAEEPSEQKPAEQPTAPTSEVGAAAAAAS